MKNERKKIIREMRGIPFFLLVEYLEEMGGTAVREDFIESPEWSVLLERMEPFRLGSLVIGQTRLTVEIDETAEDEFIKVFSMKTLRAGG